MNNNVYWSTAIFEDIETNNNSIKTLCDDTINSLPSFSCLSECGLFTEGLNSIEKMSSSIIDSVNSLTSMINQHKESIVLKENKVFNVYSGLPYFDEKIDNRIERNHLANENLTLTQNIDTETTPTTPYDKYNIGEEYVSDYEVNKAKALEKTSTTMDNSSNVQKQYIYDPYDPNMRYYVTDKIASDGTNVIELERFTNGEWSRLDESQNPLSSTSLSNNPFDHNTVNLSRNDEI